MQVTKVFRSLEVGAGLQGYGRLLARRHCGKVCFLDIRLHEERVQVRLIKGTSDCFDEFLRAPIGSLLWCEGVKGETQSKREPVFDVLHGRVFHVSTARVPDEWSEKLLAVAPREDRLALHDPSFAFACFMGDALALIREGLRTAAFREVRTGVLQTFFEGGLARPFLTRGEATGATYALALTSELKLKRLIMAGMERVFEIAESFRNEGMSRFHSPEFTLLEAYGVRLTCVELCDLLEAVVRRIAEMVVSDYGRTFQMNWGEFRANEPFARVEFFDAYREHLDPRGFDDDALTRLTALYPGKFRLGMPYFTWIMKAIEQLLAPKLPAACFLVGLPAGLSPLVRVSPDDPRVTERAFLFLRGLFVADLYEDEHRVDVVRAAMMAQARATGRDPNHSYLDALARYGIPPTAGMGVGIDRLFMAFLPSFGLPLHIRETRFSPL